MDGCTFADVKSHGVGRWSEELADDLRNRTCHAQAVRQVPIPKPTARNAPPGIPTIRDRMAQTEAVARGEPAEGRIHRGGGADLSGYFDGIAHAELMKSMSRRVSDGSFPALIKMWLETAVEETDETGHRRRATHHRDQERGTPHGAPISPLLANPYMRRFVPRWKTGLGTRDLEARIVNCVDDFVICCRHGAEEAMVRMRSLMKRLNLTVNESKARLCRLPEEKFDFPGYSFGRLYSPRTGRAYSGLKLSAKKVSSLCEEISELTQWR